MEDLILEEVIETPKKKTKTKVNAFFRKSVYFEWEIYNWDYKIDIEKAEILKNTPFYKKWIILISN